MRFLDGYLKEKEKRKHKLFQMVKQKMETNFIQLVMVTRYNQMKENY